MRHHLVIALAVLAGSLSRVAIADSNLNEVQIVSSDDELRVPAHVLSEEIARRTGLQWAAEEVATGASVTFATADAQDNLDRESFRIATMENPSRITITAAGRRGALFAVGYLLRHLDCSRGS